MFIREIRKKLKNDSGQYEYVQHRLVESFRTPNGPRQKIVLNLGTLEIPKEKHKTLANLIESKVTSTYQANLFNNETPEIIGLADHFSQIIIQKRLQEIEANVVSEPSSPLYEKIDINSIETSNGRTIGAENIALNFLNELGFNDILKDCSFTEKESKYAAAQICSRMVHPASERETARWLRETSGMGELLDFDFSHISDYTLHRIADKLYENKEQIEKKLAEKTRDIFSLDETLILYDLTNSYFESPKRDSTIAKYGRSKEKRKDCPLITLALIVDGYGFPKRSEIFAGNISEPKTLWEVLDKLGVSEKENKTRTIVIDAGIASEENLDKIRKDKRFEYVAISRKKNIEKELFKNAPSKDLTVSHKNILTVKMAKYNDETFLLCKSPDKAAKEEAMHLRSIQAFEKGLNALNDGLKKPRTQKKYSSILERIGRLKEKYKVGKYYSITVNQENDNAVDISWQYNKEKRKKEPGEYVIRTSRNDLEESMLSLIHRTLTMIESAFRWLKSDLGLRPNFHQSDKRMMSHMTISVMAYFVLAPILNRLEWGGIFVGCSKRKHSNAPWDIPYGWKNVIETMASQTRVTTSFVCEDKKRMDVRTTLEPTALQSNLCKRLRVNPRPLKRIISKDGKSVVPKNITKMYRLNNYW